MLQRFEFTKVCMGEKLLKKNNSSKVEPKILSSSFVIRVNLHPGKQCKVGETTGGTLE